MSIITKKQILERVKSGNITFKPALDEYQLQLHAVDLRLGYTFLVPRMWHITDKGREALNIDHFDKSKTSYFETIELEQGQYFELLPGEYVLASTLEAVKVPNDLMAVLYPRSSTNRKGLSVDLTGIVDSGYEGQLVIPIRNNTSSQVVKLYPGERFCQIVFDQLDANVESANSRYHQKDIIEGFIPVRGEKNAKDKTEIDYIVKGEITKLKTDHAI